MGRMKQPYFKQINTTATFSKEFVNKLSLALCLRNGCLVLNLSV
jgi:hypothetical protein